MPRAIDAHAELPLARTMQWLMRAEGAHGHTVGPIGAAQAEGLRMLVTNGQPAAYLDASLFGRALAAQLRAMESAGAEARRFLFEMGALWLGVELRVAVTAQGRHYEVDLCDALDPKVDRVRSASVRELGTLAAWPLSHWLPPALVRDCIARMTRPPIGILWAWTPIPGAPNEAQRTHFADLGAARRCLASLTLEAGDVEAAQRSLDEVLADLAHDAGTAAPQGIDSVACLIRDGFWRAMKTGRTAVAQHYVQRVLDLPDERLDTAAKVSLLRGNVFDIAGARVVASGLAAALRCGSWQTAAAFARMVASTSALPAHDKTSLLLAHDEEDCTARACGRPALHAAACHGRADAEDAVAASMRHDAIYHFVAQVVKAPGLAEHDRRSICASRHGGRTAAQQALHGAHPFVAAAMLCAVLENARGAEQALSLIEALGVEVDAVLDALDALDALPSDLAGDATSWTARLLAARHAMLPDVGAAPLDLEGLSSTEAGAPPWRSSKTTPAGQPGSTRDSAPIVEPALQPSIEEVRAWVRSSDFYDPDLGRDTLVYEARDDGLYLPCADRFPQLRIDKDCIVWSRSPGEASVELARGQRVYGARVRQALQACRDLGVQQLLRYLSVHVEPVAARTPPARIEQA